MDLCGHTNVVNLTKLTGSVGKGGKNRPLDVLVVQRLLLGTKETYTGQKSLKPDGYNGPNTEKQIGLFQQHVLGIKNPDKRVDPEGNTHKKLREVVRKDYVNKHKEAAAANQKHLINTPHFINLYKKQYPKTTSTIDLKKLLDECCADGKITDIRWIAYMLATVKRECGNTWKPIKEWGKGKGKDYSEVIEVTDPVTKKKKKNVYYGRGYVQLTWDFNYKKVGAAIGMGDKLYYYPDLALEHKTAYKIMSEGMRSGLFAKASLRQFISGSLANYTGARYIINGQDHAKEIADDAVIFENLLKASQSKGFYQELIFLFHKSIRSHR